MRVSAALLLLGNLLVSPSFAGEAVYAMVGEPTSAPRGWTAFCDESPDQCPIGATTPRDVVLNDRALDDLKKVNRWVNEKVKNKSDMDHWGVEEKWSIPTDGYGDSEDFALLKRKMLIDAGWPREALLITVVRAGPDGAANGVAVLTVKTNKGEFILTYSTNDIMLWTDSGYRFVRRQSQSDPNVWVSLGPKASPTGEAMKPKRHDTAK